MFPTFASFPTIFPIPFLTRDFFHYTSWSVVLSIKFLKPQRKFAQVSLPRFHWIKDVLLAVRISNKYTLWQRETNSTRIHQDPSTEFCIGRLPSPIVSHRLPIPNADCRKLHVFVAGRWLVDPEVQIQGPRMEWGRKEESKSEIAEVCFDLHNSGDNRLCISFHVSF